MASSTLNLKLLKKDPAIDGSDTFNIQTMLNDNWDKIDAVVGPASKTSHGVVKVGSGIEVDSEGVISVPSVMAPVLSVNGKTGDVLLIPSDLGAETPSGAQAKVEAAITSLLNGAPDGLNTLKELADALGNDADFASTVTTALASKATTSDLNLHQADAIKHITSAERDNWNGIGLNSYASSVDANGIYTVLDLKRADGTLSMKSTLSGGSSPNYTTDTWKFYDTSGTTVILTKTWTIAYDANGKITSKVVA